MIPRKILLALLPVLLFTACSTVHTDGLSRAVKMKAVPQRIISLAPSNTEILFAVGAGKQVAGRDSFSDYPAEVKSIADVGGSMGKYDIETIVALHPDLILAGEISSPDLANSLEQLGFTVYYLPNPATLEALFANLVTVGDLSGHRAEANALVSSLRKRVSSVDARIATVKSTPSVYYELDATDPTKPYTAGPGTFVDLLIARAGGANVGKSLKSPWAEISLEQLVLVDPAFIILGDAAYGVSADSLKQRDGWGKLTAVKNGQIFPFDDNLVSRPGPRLVDGLESMAKLLHPEVFR
jgi:iron complex transport system substrate-binding protein